ncbi:hypothetical protein QWY31_10300 [Cytophagales bacterium LB-30]|uniref:DUF86 domain-containing protein n=1 Tax=Shiella aurantiaca TaxID=3058365 RepID=A0ABT8F617_9BACT|nr:hypothetical protein [Shiella aurantiaca]MDN4165895.1 hypothetical protein [Shiella aurantiaca]
MEESLKSELVILLRKYAERTIELKPEISWNNYETVTERMNSIADQIEHGTYNLSHFWFSDFNGKSPCGEVLEYINMLFPELKELSYVISDKIKEIEELT